MCGPTPCQSPTCTWSREHLLQCEAKTVMRLERKERMAYYAAVREKRGKTAMDELRNLVNAAWNARQSLL